MTINTLRHKETPQTQLSDMTVLNFLLQPPLLPCLPVVAPVLLLNSAGELVGTILLIDLQSHSEMLTDRKCPKEPQLSLGGAFHSLHSPSPEGTIVYTWIQNIVLKIPAISNSKT